MSWHELAIGTIEASSTNRAPVPIPTRTLLRYLMLFNDRRRILKSQKEAEAVACLQNFSVSPTL
jgi:hypothetical protein